MKLTYLLLGALFILFFALRTKTYKLSRAQLLSLAVLLILTTIFDQIIIAFDIVRYNLNNISGLYIGFVPIEDYLYCLGAVIITPWIWEKLSND